VQLFWCYLRLEVFVLECEGADGANLDAFGALTAGGFAKRSALEGGDDSLKTPSGKANGSDAKFLLADPHAFAAEDTFVRIVGEEGAAFIDREVSFELSESFCDELYAEMLGNPLEVTGSVFLTMAAIHGVACQDQLSGGACKPESIFASRVNDHAFFNRFGARNDGFLLAFHLDKAETTRSRGWCLLLNGTKVGDVDTILQCRPEDFLSFFGLYGFAVNG
jgi:hypothetical protein